MGSVTPTRARPRAWAGAVLLAALTLAFAVVPAGAAQFGVERNSYGTVLSGNRAGEHADLKVTFTFNQERPGAPAGYVRDLGLHLPPGLAADPSATPRCLMGEVLKEACPSESAIGVAEVTTAEPPKFQSVLHSTVLVYNIEPYSSEAAAFGFLAVGLSARLDTSLPGNEEYGLTMSASDLSDAGPLISATITLWGIPADHNGPGMLETNQCHIVKVIVEEEEVGKEECVTYGGAGAAARLPFISNPVQCGSPLSSTLSVDSWQGENAAAEPAVLTPITGCEGLQFEPSISVMPQGTQSGAPTGYEIALHLPGNENPDGRAAAELKSARISLPAGTVISPSAGNGLEACSEAQFAPKDSSVPGCPPGSQIGSATLLTPVLGTPIEGQVFLGTPGCGPCSAQDAASGRMVRLLVEGAGSGVIVKLDGSISVAERTGQLTATIDQAPQLPVEELILRLKGGPTALLANPSQCGAALRGAGQLTPYSSEAATEASGAAFQLTGCGGPRFTPAFTAGTTSNQAAASSTAVVSISRADQDRTLERFTVAMPPGLLGLLSRVPACPSILAQSGTCGPQSEIGAVTIAAGPGESPLYLKGGVFLTGPYEGAPFGLSIVAPAQAGPIDLGEVAIQAGIHIDPSTAALTLQSGPLPQSLAGVPLQIRAMNLEINRPGFIVNPTDCRPLAIAATLAGAQGSTAAASQHFQSSGCAKLPFAPVLSALAGAKATRAGGAYVHVKLASGAGQANVAKIKLDLPKALPSRLTTLQGACREAAFRADPASCPETAALGTAALTTPFLRGLLTGPVYLVSHGGRAFPDLDAVLQGEGVTLMLLGTTGFTNGVGSEAFRSLPDAPISTLDLMFPAGPHSAFAANADLCRTALTMPTALTGQNGAVVKHATTVAVAGCPRGRSARLSRHAARAPTHPDRHERVRLSPTPVRVPRQKGAVR